MQTIKKVRNTVTFEVYGLISILKILKKEIMKISNPLFMELENIGPVYKDPGSRKMGTISLTCSAEKHEQVVKFFETTL